MRYQNLQRGGFSLVELSIVLVILGLLTGGILAGQSLIHAAELRSVMQQHDKYSAAMYTFRDKYFALPGDVRNATAFWGDQATGVGACADAAIADGTPGTCNGNGDGNVTAGAEGLRFWQHLALAGLIEGSYSGTGATTSIGVNVPATKLNNGGYSFTYSTFYLRNAFWVGKDSASSSFLAASLIPPEDAWNIDTKMDDGRPNIGKIFGEPGTDTSGTINCSVGAPLAYQLNETRVACRLYIFPQ